MRCGQKATLLRALWLSFAVIAAIAVTTLVIVPAVSADDDHGRHHNQLGPGCDPDRPAIPHHAGGVPAHPDHDDTAPIPCATATGWRTAETSIAISNEGTVLFQPALPASGSPVGVVRSTNLGKGWHFVNPTVTPARIAADDMNMWVDRDTGRAFWSSDLVGLAAFGLLGLPLTANRYIDHSDDDGKTWVRSSPLAMYYDHTQVFSGPPTKSLRHLMQGYPSVVYVAVSGGFTCIVFDFCQTHVAKSLDGGMTFADPIPVPYPPECPAPGTNPTGGYGLIGVVSRDGTVYLPFTPCERPYVAISRDEGSTWQLSLVSNTETIGWGELALGIDREGNLYAAWTDASDRLLYLAISRDRSLHWSKPLMIAAPGVNEAAEPLLVSGAKGQVAVTYYGSKNAPLPFPPPCGTASLTCPGYESETWDTYVTESFNALAQHPLFWSATLNHPSQPTWFGVTPSSLRVPGGFEGGSNSGAPQGGPSSAGRLDYFAMTIAPDDTPWVGFTQECPFGLPVSGNPNCSQAAGGESDGLFGMVGRLVSQGEREDRDNDH